MESAELQHEVRELITQADHLSRVSYAANRERDAEVFAALRTTLMRIDRMLGVGPELPTLSGEVDVVYQRVRDVASRASGDARDAMSPLIATAQRLRDGVALPKVIVQERSALRLVD